MSKETEKYTLRVSCSNCLIVDTIDVPKGTLVSDVSCSCCLCNELRPHVTMPYFPTTSTYYE